MRWSDNDTGLKNEGECWLWVFWPIICGDSIDIEDDMMVTGSHSDMDTVQIWSL